MVIAIADFALDKDYADNTILTEDQLDQALIEADANSVQEYANTYIKDNLVQLAIDVFGINNYTFDNDGAGNLVNTVFNKQTEDDIYNGGDINIGIVADAGWLNVDAVNAAITITPEIIGKYRATFYFTHRVTSVATTEFNVDVGFRITDGTDVSATVNSGGHIPATAGGSGVFINPVILTCIFNWAVGGAKTITLQKYVRTAVQVGANVVNAAAITGEIQMSVEKI